MIISFSPDRSHLIPLREPHHFRLHPITAFIEKHLKY